MQSIKDKINQQTSKKNQYTSNAVLIFKIVFNYIEGKYVMNLTSEWII